MKVGKISLSMIVLHTIAQTILFICKPDTMLGYILLTGSFPIVMIAMDNALNLIAVRGYK